MFPFTPRHVSEGRQYIKDARKLLAYKRDVVSDVQLEEVERRIAELEQAVKTRDRSAIEQGMGELDQACGKVSRPPADHAWRENTEVFVVAIVIALAVRTYFLQPFTIPTGSMQPTLNGIIATPNVPPPNIVSRVIQKALFFRTYLSAVAEADEQISFVQEVPRWRFFTYTEIHTTKGNVYSVRAPYKTLSEIVDLSQGREFKKGEPIVQGYMDTGDHVFVDKFTYHFIPPKHDQVFVFSTAGIHRLTRPGEPSQYYIKRLAGLPGDALRIAPPQLFIDGVVSPYSGMKRVMTGTFDSPRGSYRGYGNGGSVQGQLLMSPDETFKVPENEFFALGDNSYSSYDSRGWGTVPRQNIAGRAIFVYYPFTRHFGWIW